jgi:putative methyltransferase (TIGR04325 family)
MLRNKIQSNALLRKVFVGTPWRGVYPSFDAAQEKIPEGKSVGYNSQEAANIFRTYPVLRKRPTDYVTTFHLQPLLKEGTRLFDFGGSVGIAYYVNKQYVKLPAGLDWLVCDVPAIVEVGRERAVQEHGDGLRFTTEFSDADGADILITAGTLQFIKEPLAAKLGALKAAPPYLLINRVPAWNGEHFYTLHQIGDFFCPYQIFNRQEFIDSVTKLGYRLVDSWDCPESTLSIRLKPKLRLRHYQGFYFVKDSYPVPSVVGENR